MRTSDMIKSKFFRATDVQGRPPRVLTIADVTEELIGRGGKQEAKCFLWFMEDMKGLQLNKTRVRILEAAYGPDSEGWVGRKVRLAFDPTVEFGGRAVGGVGIQTEPGVVWTAAGASATWESPPGAPGRPPAPVWDEKRQTWVVVAAPPAAAPPIAAPRRPPPPVWDEGSQSWVTVDPGTGETQAPGWPGTGAPASPPPTISQRVDAAHPAAEGQEDWNDKIPF